MVTWPMQTIPKANTSRVSEYFHENKVVLVITVLPILDHLTIVVQFET